MSTRTLSTSVFACLAFTSSLAFAVRLSPQEAERLAVRHVHSAAQGPAHEDWQGAVVDTEPRQVLAEGVSGVAFYEFKVRAADGGDAGFVMVSSGEHDFPIPHWRTYGPTPSEELAMKGRHSVRTIFRNDVLNYNERPTSTRPRRVDTAALAAWARVRSDDFGLLDADEWETYEAAGVTPSYNQFGPGDGPNVSACMSGCGATAWAMLFGWADRQAETDSYWTSASGILAQSAPSVMDDAVKAMTWEIRNAVQTWCTPSNEGATFPAGMSNSVNYLSGRSSLTVHSDYNPFGFAETRLKEAVIASIAERKTPAIIGTGWLKHYPLATAYSRNTTNGAEWFYVNQGWGGAGNDWVAASTWYFGTITP